MFKLDDDLKTLAIVALLVYVATKVARAVKTLQLAVERGMNFGLTDEEDKKAVEKLGAKTSTLDERRQAVETLRKKVDAAKAAGYAKAVASADKALDIMAKAIRDEEELAQQRKAWEQQNKLRAVK